MEESLSTVTNEHDQLDNELSFTDSQRTQLEKEIIEQKQKLQRALNVLSKLVKSFKKRKQMGEGERSLIESDIALHTLKKRNEHTLFGLSQLILLYPETQERLESMTAAAELRLRSRPPSAGSDSLPQSPISSLPSNFF